MGNENYAIIYFVAIGSGCGRRSGCGGRQASDPRGLPPAATSPGIFCGGVFCYVIIKKYV